METDPSSADAGTETGGEDLDRRCNMPCPVENCTGRCDMAWNHGGSHQCSADASHPPF